ncbi:MAG TPA: tetratricopeptide repeat protein [Pirellulales bacterium]|nr:tetratricopeptide repeat protein [Pirellulales bacterium]
MFDRSSLAPPAENLRWRLALAAAVLLLGLSACGGCSLTSRGQNVQGVALYQQGLYQPAMQHFQQAIDADPNNPDGYYNLAAAYHQLGKLTKSQEDFDQAEHFYNQCLDRDPDGTHRECYRALAVLLAEEGRSDEAFRLLGRWSERNPSSADPKIELARLSEEFGKLDDAQHQLQDALAIDPKNARALTALAHLHERSGNTTQALADYQRSLWHDRNQPEVAARVSSLRSALSTAPLVTPQGSTRMVNVNPASPSYQRY